jgi:yecA family protein
MGMGGGTSCGIGESSMTRPTLERVQRTIGPDEPLPPMPVRPMLGPEDFAAYLAERAKKSRLCPVDRTSGLDGFLTAILIGPKFLDPRDWIASITGEAALSAPETTREHLAIQAIVAHHNRISTTLSETPDAYRPLFDRDPRLGIETTWWLVGFARGRDLASRAAAYGEAEVLAAVASLHPAIEVPNSRFDDFATAGAAQLIADDACAHEFVLGPAVTADWRELDLAAHRAIATIDGPGGQWAREGIGANVLGDPRIALVWLVNELSAHGVTVLAGQVVTTGTCVAPVEIGPGDLVAGDFGVLGSVAVRFAAS